MEKCISINDNYLVFQGNIFNIERVLASYNDNSVLILLTGTDNKKYLAFCINTKEYTYIVRETNENEINTFLKEANLESDKIAILNNKNEYFELLYKFEVYIDECYEYKCRVDKNNSILTDKQIENKFFEDINKIKYSIEYRMIILKTYMKRIISFFKSKLFEKHEYDKVIIEKTFNDLSDVMNEISSDFNLKPTCAENDHPLKITNENLYNEIDFLKALINVMINALRNMLDVIRSNKSLLDTAIDNNLLSDKISEELLYYYYFKIKNIEKFIDFYILLVKNKDVYTFGLSDEEQKLHKNKRILGISKDEYNDPYEIRKINSTTLNGDDNDC